MEFSKDMQRVMEQAVGLARTGRHRYFMPEHMIYGLTFDEEFCQEYEAGGGDAKKLRKDMLRFLKEQAGSAGEEGARLTTDTERVLRMAEAHQRPAPGGYRPCAGGDPSAGGQLWTLLSVGAGGGSGGALRKSVPHQSGQGENRWNGEWGESPDLWAGGAERL